MTPKKPVPDSSGRKAAPPATTLVRAWQPPHGEFDRAVRQLAPAFDRGHVGGLGEAAEHLARLFARGLPRQRKRLAAVRIAARRLQSRAVARHPAGEIFGAAVTHTLTLQRHCSTPAGLCRNYIGRTSATAAEAMAAMAS